MLRLNKIDIIDSSDELRKNHTKKYCRVLGLSLADLTKNINKGLGDNKGITRDVFLSFMVRINDDKDNQIIGEYLYGLFCYSAKFGVEKEKYALSLDYSENEGNSQYDNYGAVANQVSKMKL